MLLTTKLLGFLNRVFTKDPKSVLGFQLFYDGEMAWTIADAVLTITTTGGSGSSQIVDLTGFTVGDLSAYLAALPGFSVTSLNTTGVADLSAVVLLDGSGDQNVTGGNDLSAYTSIVWTWMDAAANELRLAQQQSAQALLQMTVPTAAGSWLDYHGNYYDTPRLPDELDGVYAPRIVSNVIRARGNNVAIEAALSIAFNAVMASVIDYDVVTVAADGTPSYGLFDIDIARALGDAADLSVNASARNIVASMRDAGTHLRTLTVTVVAQLVETTLIVLSTGRFITIPFQDGYEYREDGGRELREDGGIELRE